MASIPNATTNDSHCIYYEKCSIILQNWFLWHTRFSTTSRVMRFPPISNVWTYEFFADKLQDAIQVISQHSAKSMYKQEAQQTARQGKRYRSMFSWWWQQTVRRFLPHLASCDFLLSPMCGHTSFSHKNYRVQNKWYRSIPPKVLTNKKLSRRRDKGNATANCTTLYTTSHDMRYSRNLQCWYTGC